MAANKKTADKTKNTASGRKKTSSKTSSKGAKTASRTKASAVPKRSSGLSPRVRAILYAAVAAVFVCIIFIKGSNVWTMIRSFFFGVLGFGIFLVPVTLFYLCVMTEKEKQVARYKLKLFLCVVIILFIGALIYAGSGAKYSDMNFFACLGNLFKDASDTSRYMTFDCGIIGGLLGYPLVVLFGSTAALFTSFVVTAALILIVANISIKDMTAAASRTAVHIREAGEERARVRRERREENRERKLAERGDIDIALEGENRKSSGSYIDIPLDDKKTKVKKAKSAVNGIDTDIADSKEENAADKDLSQDLINIINRASKPMGKSADNTVSAIAEDISNEKSASKAEQTEVKPDAETENIVKKALLKSKKDNSEEAGDEIVEQLDRAVRSDNSQKEEKKYQSGQGNIEKQLYAKDSISEIDRELLLERGRLVTVRPHSRFVEFPEHRHNYVEMMYVVQGNITHIIEGKELTLHKGDVLMLNQQVRHAIRRAEYEDIGINFIALPEFFEIPLSMLHEKNVLAEFIVGAFRQKDPVSHYLLFQLQEDPQVENLMENMIDSMLHEHANEDVINQYSMGLVFLYLLNHLESLSHNSSMDYKETVVQAVLGYINSDCKNANLTKIAADTHQSMTVLSRLIKQKTGYNFQELLQHRRFETAEHLLLETDLSVEEIALDVGYENQSYFFRQFKERYGMTPRKYRLEHYKR